VAVVDAQSHRFAGFEVHPAQRQLVVAGMPVPIGARAFDLLVTLIEHRDRMVSKNELLDRVWPGVIVEENNLQVQVSTLRKLLGPSVIVTIPGRGYRFVAVDAAAAPAAPAPVAEAQPPAPLAPRRGNLPRLAAPLIGREADLAHLDTLLQQHALVSLVGPGGIGKTTLALAAAAHAATQRPWPDGAWLVELSGLADAAPLPDTIAQALDLALPHRQGSVAELAAALAPKSLLLVLDNCEALVAALGPLVAALLQRAPGLRILLTSQEPLHLPMERLMRLGPLALPAHTTLQGATASGAVALFADRVRAVQPAFELSERNLQPVIDICVQLDGMPLAIELAAARVPLLGVQGLRQRLDERFRVLTGGPRRTDRRHATLRAALDWSHQLLAPPEQAVFRRLGVFAGGFTLEAAQHTAADELALDEWTVIDHLGSLVDKSLVMADAAEPPRYRLPETMRAYAMEHLADAGELHATQRRHAQAVLALFQRGTHELMHGALTMDGLAEHLAPELDNLRAAMAWAMGPHGDRNLALALAAEAAHPMHQAGLSRECLAWMQALEPLIDDDRQPAQAAPFLLGLATVSQFAGLPPARRLVLLQRAQALWQRLDQPMWEGRTLCLLLLVAVRAGNAAAVQAAQQRLALLRRGDWPSWLQCAQAYHHGVATWTQGGVAQARQIFIDALPLCRASHDRSREYAVRLALSAVLLCEDRPADALRELEALRRDARRGRWNHLHGALVIMLACEAQAALGDLPAAQATALEAMADLTQNFDSRLFGAAFSGLIVRQQRHREAMWVIGASDATLARAGEPRWPNHQRVAAQAIAEARAAHGDAEVQAWLAQGATLDEDTVYRLITSADDAPAAEAA
jgi:predicted ATPase/DNA-binding winged helix-turn-helix (wHTH) protein